MRRSPPCHAHFVSILFRLRQRCHGETFHFDRRLFTPSRRALAGDSKRGPAQDFSQKPMCRYREREREVVSHRVCFVTVCNLFVQSLVWPPSGHTTGRLLLSACSKGIPWLVKPLQIPLPPNCSTGATQVWARPTLCLSQCGGWYNGTDSRKDSPERMAAVFSAWLRLFKEV